MEVSMANEFREDLEIALSGGGFRASAFGLGVLVYLVDSGLNRRVKLISSVSGGSITNGFVANKCDFKAQDPESFRPIVSQLARLISGNGKYGGFWLVSRPYVALLGIGGLALLGLLIKILIGFPIVVWAEAIVFMFGALAWSVLALNRGAIVLNWISRTFFQGEDVLLGKLSGRSIDHVFCATDLTSSGSFFFSTKGGGRVFSESYGRGDGSKVALKVAVASSAAFPPLIPPIDFRLQGRGFSKDKTPPERIYLTDGGVWNNLATEWSMLRKSIMGAEMAWVQARPPSPGETMPPALVARDNCPLGGVLVIANASKPETRRNLWMLKFPVVSFVTTLIRVLDVAVNSTVRGRSSDIEHTARMRMLNNPSRWELGEDAPLPQHAIWDELPGSAPPVAVAVEMTRWPGETALAYQMVGGLAQWVDAPERYTQEHRTAIEKLTETLGKDGDIIPTTLDNLGPERTLRMIVLGYLNARETFAVVFANHTPPALPTRKWFEDLVYAT